MGKRNSKNNFSVVAVKVRDFNTDCVLTYKQVVININRDFPLIYSHL